MRRDPAAELGRINEQLKRELEAEGKATDQHRLTQLLNWGLAAWCVAAVLVIGSAMVTAWLGWGVCK